jgi:glycolate oxidase
LTSTFYGAVTAQVIDALKSIVGERDVLTGDDRQNYSRDETPGLRPVLPDAVVRPRDAPSVARVMRLANEARIPVTPRGAGTGLSGGAVPLHGGIVMSLEAMNRIVEIDADNFTATVEPGVALSDLHNAVESRGLYYPLYPGEMTATIGGNAATNAGGMRAVRYGVTRNFVLGLEAVLPSGEIVDTGGKYIKCSTAYDLTQLIVGSEGTLGVITKVILRLIPPPGRRDLVLAPFGSLQDAVSAVPYILKERILPVGIEFIEKDAVRLTEEFRGSLTPIHDYEASLMFIVEGEGEEEVTRISTRVGEICLEHGALDAFMASGDRARELLAFREKAWPAIAQTGRADMADVVVPRSRVAEFVEQARRASHELGITTYAVGHAGDGNVHLTPLTLGAGTSREQAVSLFRKFYELGVSMGGTISGEHGIGVSKKPFLDIAVSQPKLELLKRIKNAFDPNNIMNPGKIFDM